jgi:hypothetical protein
MTQVRAAEGQSANVQRQDPISIGLAKYVWITLAAVAVTQGGVAALQWSLVPTRVRPLRHALSELPLTMGAWTGKDNEVDQRLFQAVGAEQQVNRLYTNSARDVLYVHSAVWMSSADDWLPHLPQVCYAGAGWLPVENSIISLPNRPDLRIAVQTFERAGQRVKVGYWYQMGKSTFVDREEARKVRRAFWGKREWFPVCKVLIQIEDSDAAQSKLVDLAGPIYDFDCEL